MSGKSRKSGLRRRGKPAEVHSLNKTDRALDAQGFVTALVADPKTAPRGIVVCQFDEDGRARYSVFGNVTQYQLSYMSLLLGRHAMDVD